MNEEQVGSVGLTAAYGRFARRRLDPLAAQIRAGLEIPPLRAGRR